jgi:hypothetical protein
MEITLDDLSLTANVTDFDQSDWSSQSSTIPDDYTIAFNPSVDEATLQSLNTGRTINYVQKVVYTTSVLGNGYVSMPSLVVVQQLLPLSTQST